MNYTRQFSLTATLLASAAVAAAQGYAPPAPPEPPTPVAAPAPQAAAVPPVPPAAPAAAPTPMKRLLGPPDDDGIFQIDREQAREMAEQAREQARQLSEETREQARQMAQQDREQGAQVREQAAQMREQINREVGRGINLNLDLDVGPFHANLPLAQVRGLQGFGAKQFRNDNTLYGRGLSALDDHHYDQALDVFTEVVNRGGPKADGALYWKAYTLNKLGRRDEAIATIAQLRTSFASSHWLEDAKALELEVKQASGARVSPENEADDDLKLMALNGLSQSDPERTYPLIEKLLKGPASPKLKQKAVFVLATNSSPRAQQLLEQIARGNGNPDLQATAIRYMVEDKQQPNRAQVLMEIYSSSSDPAVKREILNAFRNSRDYDHLLQIARTEKSADLRQSAYGGLGEKTGNAELWQLFQAETSPDARIQIIESMSSNGNTEKLAEVARTDKDPKVRIAAIRVLASYKAANMPETMTSIYSAEQDPQVKRVIIDRVAGQRNAKTLVDLFHKESNIDLKKDIVQRLQNMRTPEANELFLEILK